MNERLTELELRSMHQERSLQERFDTVFAQQQAIDRLNRELGLMVDQWRPDRATTVDETATAADWCAHHLTTIGTCEPRAKGDLCRWCDDFRRAYNVLPTRGLLEKRRDGARITQALVDESLALHMKALRAARKRRRRQGR